LINLTSKFLTLVSDKKIDFLNRKIYNNISHYYIML